MSVALCINKNTLDDLSKNRNPQYPCYMGCCGLCIIRKEGVRTLCAVPLHLKPENF